VLSKAFDASHLREILYSPGKLIKVKAKVSTFELKALPYRGSSARMGW